MGVLFWNQPHHPFLSDPCPLSRGRVQERVQGDPAYRRRFPLHPPLQAPKGVAPLRTPFIRRSCRQLTEYLNKYSDIPLILLPLSDAAPVAAPCSGYGPASPVPPRPSMTLNPSPPRRRCSRLCPRPNRTRPLVCAHAGEASARRSLPSLLLGSHHVAPSASCIFAPSLRVARLAENLPLRGSSSPPGFRFPPCAPSVRARRARRKAPDGARTYREGERSWKNFTQRQRR